MPPGAGPEAGRRQEMAWALTQAADKVNLALLELELLGARCERAPTECARIDVR